MPSLRAYAALAGAALTLLALLALAGPAAAGTYVVQPVVRGMTITKSSTSTTASTVRYTVRAGDSFSAIAARFRVSASTLARSNGLRLTSTLHDGQVLVVPGVQLPANLPKNLPSALMANPDRLLLYPYFAAAAKESGVPADLLMATAYIESGWKESARSPTGAVGVGQLLPGTSRWVAVVLLHEALLDPANARDNIRMSARFLRYLLDAVGRDARRALASYYQGPGSVARDGITPLGLAYAGRIMAVRAFFG